MATNFGLKATEHRQDFALTILVSRLLILGVATASWNGIALGGLQVIDAVLLTAFFFLFLEALHTLRGPLLPWWGWVGLGGLVLTVFLQLLFPTGDAYLDSRTSLASISSLLAGHMLLGPVVQGGQWAVAFFLLPLIVCAIGSVRGDFTRQIACSWMLGITASALVATSDHLGFSSVGTTLLGYSNITGRESGLSSHPNNLGISCAMALPIAVWVVSRRVLIGSLAFIALSTGVLLSGSRAAQVAAILVVLASLWNLRRSERLRTAALVVAPLLVAIVGALYFLGSSDLFRFSGSVQYVDESDEGRGILAAQAVDDFMHSPVIGIGLGHITEAHSVLLQLAAGGGIVMLSTFLLYLAGVLRDAWGFRTLSGSIVPVCGLSVAAWLLAGLFSNQLVDRYLYLPVAVIAASGSATMLKRPSSDSDEAVQ